MPKERLATMWSQVERWARGRERGNGKAPAGIRHVSTVPEASDEVIMEEPTEAGADVIADAAATATTSDLPVTAMDESLMEEVVVVAAAASTASRTGDTGGRVCASHVTGNAR
eukprot:ctg_794.g460